MPEKWLVERVSEGGPLGESVTHRLEQIEQTHDVVSIAPDPHKKYGYVIIAKQRPVGYDG